MRGDLLFQKSILVTVEELLIIAGHNNWI